MPGKGLRAEPDQAVVWVQPVERGRVVPVEPARAAAWAPRVPLKERAIPAEAPTWAAPGQAGEAAAAPWVEERVQAEWEAERDRVVQAAVPVQAAGADRDHFFRRCGKPRTPEEASAGVVSHDRRQASQAIGRVRAARDRNRVRVTAQRPVLRRPSARLFRAPARRTSTVLPSPLHKEEYAQTNENKANHCEPGRGTDLCHKLQAAKIHLLGELR